VNLLAETIESITYSGHTADDVVFIGSRLSGHTCTWDQFRDLADVEYDNGYGAPEVASDLEIAFRDGGRLRRREHDGAEGWEYVPAFVAPAGGESITRLTVNGTGRVGWCTVAELAEMDKGEF
jgi:hypothetical protein